jgi:hypothetical protein
MVNDLNHISQHYTHMWDLIPHKNSFKWEYIPSNQHLNEDKKKTGSFAWQKGLHNYALRKNDEITPLRRTG